MLVADFLACAAVTGDAEGVSLRRIQKSAKPYVNPDFLQHRRRRSSSGAAVMESKCGGEDEPLKGIMTPEVRRRSSSRSGCARECSLPACADCPSPTLMRAGRDISCDQLPLALPSVSGQSGQHFEKPAMQSQFCITPAKLVSRTPCKIQQVRDSWKASEAQRKADKAAAELQRKIAIAEAKEAITIYLTSAGESAKSVETILGLISDNQIFKACPGTEVDANKVDVFRNKAKQALYKKKLLDLSKEWQLSREQKEDVVNTLLMQHPCSELADLVQDNRWRESFVHALKASVDSGSSRFQCPICMEPLITINSLGRIDMSNNWFVEPRGNEHWHNQPCGHACCRSCMATWAETAINDQKLKVKCPAENCSYCLFDDDLKKLVSPQIFARHQEHKSADYLQHLKASLKESIPLKMWLKSHARPCPDCHVIVSRSEGCDHMMCVCGTRFCYACGFKKCKCGSHKGRADIWNPRQHH